MPYHTFASEKKRTFCICDIDTVFKFLGAHILYQSKLAKIDNEMQ